MKCSSRFFGGLAAFTLAGCAGGHVVEGLNGRYARSFTVEERDHHAQVEEVWQFNGTTASLHATWKGLAQGGQYTTVVDQGWSMKYRGQGVFQLEEQGRRMEGPPLADLDDAYEMELDGNEVQVNGGPSDAPLHRLYATTATAPTPREYPAAHSTTKKKH